MTAVPVAARHRSLLRPPWPGELRYAVVGLVAVCFASGVAATADLDRATPVLLSGAGVLVAVVLSGRWASVAMGLLLVLAATVFGPANAVMVRVGGLSDVLVFVGSFVGVCWVTFRLGAGTELAWSLPLIAAWAGLVIVALDVDAPLLMLPIGWWAVGQVVRSHQRLVNRIEARAEDLRREQQRFADEAVRLERVRIARELHDVVAHAMTVIVIQSRAGQQLVDHDAGAVLDSLDAVAAAAAAAREDVAALVALMEPSAVRPLTRRLLDELVERARRTGTTIELHVEGDPDDLPPAIGAVVHRAVQEGLTNTFRYAPGTDVQVRLRCGPGPGPEVEVVNGPAATAGLADLGAGRGLAGLRERAVEAGLDVQWGPTLEGGWRLGVR